MTNLIQSDHGNWSAHAHIDRYRAEEERAVMHTLYPTRSALLEKAVKGGWDSRLPQILRPHGRGRRRLHPGPTDPGCRVKRSVQLIRVPGDEGRR